MKVRGCGRLALLLVLGTVVAPQALIAQRLVGRPAQLSQQGEGSAQRNPARGVRPVVPPITRNMDAAQLTQHIDALALVQAQQALKLTDDQQPQFASKLVRLQNLRRRVTNGRRQIFNELRGLLDAPTPRDEAITEKLRALNEFNRRGTEEAIKAYEDLDAILSPWQRGQFRLFEERLERQKVEMLSRITGARAGGS